MAAKHEDESFGTAQRGTGMGPGCLSFQTFVGVNSARWRAHLGGLDPSTRGSGINKIDSPGRTQSFSRSCCRVQPICLVHQRQQVGLNRCDPAPWLRCPSKPLLLLCDTTLLRALSLAGRHPVKPCISRFRCLSYAAIILLRAASD